MKVSIIPFILKKLKQGLGIVQDTDTATQAISQGKYVFWKGSVKKASSAISENDTLSASNLSDVTDGALNAISDQIGTVPSGKTVQGQIDSLNAKSSGTISKASGIDGTLANITLRKVGNMVVASARIHSMTPRAASGVFMTIPAGYRPAVATDCIGYMTITSASIGHAIPALVTISTNGNITFTYSSNYTTDQVGFAGCFSLL